MLLLQCQLTRSDFERQAFVKQVRVGNRMCRSKFCVAQIILGFFKVDYRDYGDVIGLVCPALFSLRGNKCYVRKIRGFPFLKRLLRDSIR